MKLSRNIKLILAEFLYRVGFLFFLKYIRNFIIRNPSLIVLCYHRVTDKSFLLSPQCISVSDFESQLITFKSNFDIWTLFDVKQYLDGNKKLNKDTVVFSFDDGYLDNYTIAHPLLLKYNVHATFFISSTPCINNSLYWIDELSNCLLAFKNKQLISFDYLPDDLKSLLFSFIRADIDTEKSFAKKIFIFFNSLSEHDKYFYLNKFKCYCDFGNDSDLNDYKVISVDLALEMQKMGHDIGAHSMTHPRFSNLSDTELKSEISHSINFLRNLGLNIKHFAYPFGKLSDFDNNISYCQQLFDEFNIDLAVTTVDDKVRKSDHPYLLPRKVMSSQSIAQIILKLEMLAWNIN
jgi:peptidoglycan/xylan/chitin deacetylase (PgdA/CDA1 family)